MKNVALAFRVDTFSQLLFGISMLVMGVDCCNVLLHCSVDTLKSLLQC